MTATSSLSASAWQDSETVRRATPEQRAFYRQQGYLKFGRIFRFEEMEALRTQVDSMIASLPAGKRPEEMDVPHFQDPGLFRYLADPRVLDVIESLIGPDIALDHIQDPGIGKIAKQTGIRSRA